MAWKTVNAAQSMDAQSQNAFRRFSNILMSHRNANGNIQYNPQDKSYRLVNDNGIFYSNGRFFSRSGARGNYDINTGNFLKKKVNKPAAPVKQQSSAGSKDIVSQVTNPNSLYGYKEQVNKQNKIPTNSPATNKPRTALAPKTPVSNSWINKGRGIWNYNGVSQTDVANAYKTGDFSKVGSYLSQHKDLASYLNNIYSKRGGNQFNSSTPTKRAAPIQGTPGYGKIQQNMLNNAVQNQTSQYQLTKPNLGYNPSQNNQLVNLKFEKGGQMYKYSAGAQMVQPQQASGQQGIEQQAMTLVQAAMQGDQQANQTIQKIMQAAQQGDQQAAQVAKLLQAIVQQMKGSRKARLGAKLDYIKQSIGECPEGQEVVYFKKGGEICKICAGKKMQDGGKSDPIKNFKKKKDVAKQTYQRNPYTRGKSAKEIAEMQRRNRQEASAGKGENDANVAPWNYKKEKDEIKY